MVLLNGTHYGHNILQMGLSIDCARIHSNQHAHSEVILKENKTDDLICLHYGVHVYICSHMITSSDITIDVTNTWVICIILFIAFFLYVVYVTFHKYTWDAGNMIHKVPKPNFYMFLCRI